jgi:hypothetical protein
LLCRLIIYFVQAQQFASSTYGENFHPAPEAIDHAIGTEDHLSDSTNTDFRNNPTTLWKISQTFHGIKQLHHPTDGRIRVVLCDVLCDILNSFQCQGGGTTQLSPSKPFQNSCPGLSVCHTFTCGEWVMRWTPPLPKAS